MGNSESSGEWTGKWDRPIWWQKLSRTFLVLVEFCDGSLEMRRNVKKYFQIVKSGVSKDLSENFTGIENEEDIFFYNFGLK